MVDHRGYIFVCELWAERRIAAAYATPLIVLLWRPCRTVWRCSDGSLDCTVALPASGGNTPGRPWPVSWWHGEQ